MKNKIWIFVLVVLGMLSMLFNSCKKEETNDPAPVISDENFYLEIAVSLINCYTDIYNQNLAGKPTGNQNITASGPMGGMVTITGSDSYDNTHGITTTNLLLAMEAVNYTYTYTGNNNKSWVTQIKITGSTTYSGSFSDSYTSVNHQAANLHIAGTVSYDGIVREINTSGSVNINRSSTTSANIFGHSVSW